MKRLVLLAVTITLLLPVMVNAQMFDQYGGYTGLQGTNTSGFFRAEKINGRYWLVTPDNNIFWSTGICSILFRDSWGAYNPTLDYRPSCSTIKAKYPGGEAEWRQVMIDRMNRWQYNTVAAWNSATVLPTFAESARVLNIGSRAKERGCRMIDDKNADVFDPMFALACDDRAKALASNKNNPFTIGYFPDNELKWTKPSGYNSLPDAYIAMPGTAYGKQHWVNNFLKDRYATLSDLNAAWGTSYSDWTDILSITSLPDNAGYPARLNDKIEFLEVIADQYYRLASSKIRQYDPNHIVFSSRWAMWGDAFAVAYYHPFNERVWKAEGRYCDVIANNGYVDFGYAESVFQHCSRMFNQTKKPFILTEHNYNANDSVHDYKVWSVSNQMARADSYIDQIKKLFDLGVNDDPNDPGNPAKICMGIHWFILYDQPALGRPDGEDYNDGLCNLNDEAFLPLTDVMEEVHSQMLDYALNDTPFDIPTPPTAVSPVGSTLQNGERASSFERIYFAGDRTLRYSMGSLVNDPDTGSGKAWFVGLSSSWVGYLGSGPYASATSMWPGAQCTVTFRLKVSDNSSSQTVTTIDAVSSNGTHATKTVKGTDFTSANAYQDISISFTTPSTGANNWQFRIHYAKVTNLYLDNIKISIQPKTTYATGPASDGIENTLWSSTGHDTPDATEWASISLGSTAIEVNSVRVTGRVGNAAGMPVDFQLQHSMDGTNWSTIPGQVYTGYQFNRGSREFKFAPVTCKYIRLYATKLGQDADGKYRMVLSGIDVLPVLRDTTPTFAWNYSGNASSYTLLLSPIMNFPEEQTIRVEGITGTSYTPTVPLAQGAWYWTVKAINSAGREGRYLNTVKCWIGDLPATEIDHAAALKCEAMPGWRNMDDVDTGGDGYAFAFLDDTIKTEGQHSLRVAITANSLNKTTRQINKATQDIPFRYSGHALDYSGTDTITFDIYPKRFADTAEVIVTSTKYLHFRMIDAGGNVVADQAVDPTGTLPIGQWSTINVPLSGRRYQVTDIEFYIKSAAQKLTWDARVYFNIDNLTTAPLADMTPPTVPSVAVSGYTVNNTVWANLSSSDPETGIGEYLYCIGSTPGADNLVPWTSNGNSASVTVHGLSLADGDLCYVSAKAMNGIGVASQITTSKAIRKVSLASDANAARKLAQGSWVAVENQVVVGCFSGRFYAEKEDRSSGIGVVSSDVVNIGDRVNIYGQTQILGKELVVSGRVAEAAPGSPLQPLAMNQRASGGAGVGLQLSPMDDATSNKTAQGLSTLGCLITLWGKATYVDPNGAYFYIDDGSGLWDGSGHTGVKVESANMFQPALGSFARATGVMTAADVAGKCVRFLRPRANNDLVLTKVANYMLNGGFESGVLSPWQTIGTAGEVRTGNWYLSSSPHSGSWFFGSYASYTVKSGVIYQVATVLPDSSYTASCWSGVLHGANEADAAMNRIGIDPTGGTDPNAATVVWSAWDMQENWYYIEWRPLSTPSVPVSGDKATVFLQYFQQNNPGYHLNCFDDIMLSETGQ